ncbi:hypothetical protein AVEN_93574-1 [Araneus ventricosus]|uniref:Uncharacterized protein n=1 Tax=Araneus ventricosus TaxID=182803 RepID=A0A4Y2API6_ARAVE|nr:hypothetical protein AVEN_93574-1 [Araneus ventricosus]
MNPDLQSERKDPDLSENPVEKTSAPKRTRTFDPFLGSDMWTEHFGRQRDAAFEGRRRVYAIAILQMSFFCRKHYIKGQLLLNEINPIVIVIKDSMGRQGLDQ